MWQSAAFLHSTNFHSLFALMIAQTELKFETLHLSKEETWRPWLSPKHYILFIITKCIFHVALGKKRKEKSEWELFTKKKYIMRVICHASLKIHPGILSFRWLFKAFSDRHRTLRNLQKVSKDGVICLLQQPISKEHMHHARQIWITQQPSFIIQLGRCLL